MNHEIAVAPANSRKADIAALFDRCNAALATGDADTVAKRYPQCRGRTHGLKSGPQNGRQIKRRCLPMRVKFLTRLADISTDASSR